MFCTVAYCIMHIASCCVYAPPPRCHPQSLEPVITVGTGVTTTLEDTPVVLPAVAVVHDSTSVSELLVSVNVIGGEVTLSTTAGLSIVSGNVTGIQTNFTMRGHKAYINAAMAAMTFTPALHFYGGAIISVTAQEVGAVFRDTPAPLFGCMAHHHDTYHPYATLHNTARTTRYNTT